MKKIFQKITGKRDLQQLERDFTVLSLKYGNISYDIHILEKERTRIHQEMDHLRKEGATMRDKVKKEVIQKIAEGEAKNESVQKDTV